MNPPPQGPVRPSGRRATGGGLREVVYVIATTYKNLLGIESNGELLPLEMNVTFSINRIAGISFVQIKTVIN